MNTTNTYRAKVEGQWFGYLALFIAALMWLLSLTSSGSSEPIWSVLIIWAVIALMYYLAQRTSYVLTDEALEINWLFYNKKLPYSYIDRIKASNYPASGYRFAWASTGHSIYYASGSILFISVLEEEAFINDLKAKAPHIKEIS